MNWIRLAERGGARRLAAVDDYQFPGSARQRFALGHPGLSAGDVRTVEAATRQWFRLAVRHPRAKLSMPSVVVGDFWHEFVRQTREYAEFCDAAFGRFLHHAPDAAAADQGGGLRTTFGFAQEDEGSVPPALPLLFRIDRDLAVTGGRHYLADCGGRGVCYDLPGATCLQHVDGVRPATRRLGPSPAPRDMFDGGGCGG
jgi:hypothetical protein